MDDVVEEDEDFLSLLDAVEADHIKRRKVNQGSTSSSSPNIEEGKYMAALKGSNSHLWQAYSNPKTTANKRPPPDYGGGGSSGVGYKCQQPGHWAKDCGGGGVVNFTEKQCPCGAAPCLILTSNTDRNPGRKFYKCSLREESGGCKFFEWCDAAAQTSTSSGDYGGQPIISNTEVAQPSMQIQMQCPCGAGPCSRLISKTHRNMGRQFFKCPLKQGEVSCNFFQWCDEVNPTNNSSPVAVQSFSSMYDSTPGNSERTRYYNTPGNSGRIGPSPCYKCGMDGHWAKDCPKSSSSTIGLSSTGQGDRSSCFKCGQAGHWAKDCLFQSSNFSYSGGESSNSRYNCGGIGLQASSMRKFR